MGLWDIDGIRTGTAGKTISTRGGGNGMEPWDIEGARGLIGGAVSSEASAGRPGTLP